MRNIVGTRHTLKVHGFAKLACFKHVAHVYVAVSRGLVNQAYGSADQTYLVHLYLYFESSCCHWCRFIYSLYLRTFGASNHEVKTTADGQLETIRPIEGRFYRFNLVQSTPQDQGQLVVTEIDPTQPDAGRLELQLLDPGADDGCSVWGNELPVRLREMHSHWYDRCVTQAGWAGQSQVNTADSLHACRDVGVNVRHRC